MKNKSTIINIRVTEEEKNLIKHSADKFNMSMSKFILSAVIESRIIVIYKGNFLVEELYKFNKNLERFNKYLPKNEFKFRLLLQRELQNFCEALKRGRNDVNSEI